MANKRNKSRKQQLSRRNVAPAPTSPSTPASAAPGGTPSLETTVPRQQPAPATSRYASAVSGPRRAGTTTATVGTIDIDERVPYFGRDLRRIVITAAVMMVIIVGASFFLH